MEGRIEIPDGELEFCLICALDKGMTTPAYCRVFSAGHGTRIPVCCHCCGTYLQDMPRMIPAVIFVN